MLRARKQMNRWKLTYQTQKSTIQNQQQRKARTVCFSRQNSQWLRNQWHQILLEGVGKMRLTTGRSVKRILKKQLAPPKSLAIPPPSQQNPGALISGKVTEGPQLTLGSHPENSVMTKHRFTECSDLSPFPHLHNSQRLAARQENGRVFPGDCNQKENSKDTDIRSSQRKEFNQLPQSEDQSQQISFSAQSFHIDSH